MRAISNKEIKSTALKRLKGNWGNSIALTVLSTVFICFMISCEILVYILSKEFSTKNFYSFDFLFKTTAGRISILIRLFFIFIFLMPELYICRRLYIEVSSGRGLVSTRQYLQHNFFKIIPRAIYTAVITTMLKLFVAAPIAIGMYEIYYWGWVCKIEELTSIGLFCFMLSVGFTFVWIGVFLHYCISLSLTRYIMTLNPRANIFDACDLSVKLMEGKHLRYMKFLFSFLKYLPTFILIYPVFVIMPYYRFSYIVFVEDIMGDFWQDKFPAMIQRWEKYAN